MKYFLTFFSIMLFTVINAQSNQSLETLLQNKLNELVIEFELKGISAAFNIENEFLWTHKGINREQVLSLHGA